MNPIRSILGKRYKYKYPIINVPVNDIKLQDLSDPIMYGKDEFGKYFMTIKVVGDFYGEPKIYAQTFYQRYTDYNFLGSRTVLGSVPFLTFMEGKNILPHQIDVLERLVKNEMIGKISYPSGEGSFVECIYNVRLATSTVAIYHENIFYNLFYKFFEKSFIIADTFLSFFGY